MNEIPNEDKSPVNYEPLDGWKLHPKAELVCIMLMCSASATAMFGSTFGISVFWKAAVIIPGICGATLLVFQHASIWQRINR